MQQSIGGRRRPNRPPRLPSIPTFPRGPRYLDFASLPKVGGPGEPPAGFVSPTNSRIEWMVYWALSKVFGLPRDPRKGPFTGHPGIWEYQRPYGDYGQPGSTTIDFVVWPHSLTRNRAVAIRIVTETYHELVDPRKRAKDVVQKQRLSRFYDVKDLHEVHIIYDKTGQTAIRWLKHLLSGGESPDPFREGANYLRIRDRELT